jgi:hypothetical protein
VERHLTSGRPDGIAKRGRAGTAAIAGRALALYLAALQRTCRVEFLGDPRPELRRAGRPYVLALLHAHQLAALVACDEPRLAAMVSRSRDGDLLVASLRRAGVEAVRGSSRRGERDKGGRSALRALARHLGSGHPALLAVDGPRGPRGHVQLGAIELSERAGAPLVPLVALSSARVRIRRSWDRFQIPLPGARIDVHFGMPLEVERGEGAADFRERVEVALRELERRWDRREAEG